MRKISRILLLISVAMCILATVVSYVNPKIEKLSPTKAKYEIMIGSSVNLDINVSPDIVNISADDLDWDSLNENIAKVDDCGEVTGVGVGTVIIKGFYKGCVVEYSIVVKPINVSQISLSCNYNAIHPAETMQMEAVIEPYNATFKDVVWESSNTQVATISEEGVVEGVSEGQVTIKAKTHNNIIAEKTIEIKQTIEIESIEILATSTSLTYGNHSISCKYYPANADNKTVEWASDNSDVVSIGGNGYIFAKKDGSATITATTPNGVSDTIDFYVPRVEARTIYIADEDGVNLLQGLELREGDTYQLYVEFFHYGSQPPTTREIEWSSSNPSAVSVDQNGLITVHTSESLFMVTITAKVKGVSGVQDIITITSPMPF